MAQLLELALRYQQALDSPNGTVTSAAADESGRALCEAVLAVLAGPAGGARRGTQSIIDSDLTVLEPIILRTTLATSLVAQLERFPLQDVTLQMLWQPAGTSLIAALICAEMLSYLCISALKCIESDGTAPILLLRQVGHASCLYMQPSASDKLPSCLHIWSLQ